MWVCFNDAFVSAVQDRNNPDRLCVRARKREHLERLFPKMDIIVVPNRDYACRVFVTMAQFADLMTRRVQDIGYPNFKDSVREDGLHDLYADFWELHWSYQEEDNRL